MSLEQIAQLVDRLDDPDAHEQRRIMELLVQLGPDAVDPLVANMGFASPLALGAIVRVLGAIGSTRAMVPLMRFIFDRRDDIDAQDARGLAMRALLKLAQPEHGRKLFDFLMDMREDADPFVRGYAIESLGKFGDPRAMPLIRDALNDPHEFVRERARLALSNVSSAPARTTGNLRSELSDEVLLQRIRGTDESEREFYVNALMERPNAFELAAQLVSEHGKSTITGLQILQQIQDPRARRVAVHHYRSTENTTHRAIALRILAAQLQGDATPDELQIIEFGLVSADEFVRLAALAAAGASGHAPYLERAIRALDARSKVELSTASAALARGITPRDARFVPALRDALGKLQRRRRTDDHPDLIEAEAQTLNALRVVLSGGMSLGTAQVHHDALRSLRDGHVHMPILIQALRLLRDTTPDEGLPETRRWDASDAMSLVPLADHPDLRIRHRALDLLVRGAPTGLSGLTRRLESLLYDDRNDLTGQVIPLLKRAGNDDARRLLQDLAGSHDENVRLAAEDALRTMRSQHRTLDAKFSMKS